MNEKQLKDAFQKMQNGDREQFALIYEQLKKPVFTIAYRITLSQASAEDITHDLFLELLSSPPPPKVENPRAWIFKMARNLAIDALRKKQPIEPLEESVLSGEPDFTLRLDMETAFSRLSEDERQLVALHLSAGLTFREVASIVERPLGTVLWRYRLALGKLRNLLDGGNL